MNPPSLSQIQRRLAENPGLPLAPLACAVRRAKVRYAPGIPTQTTAGAHNNQTPSPSGQHVIPPTLLPGFWGDLRGITTRSLSADLNLPVQDRQAVNAAPTDLIHTSVQSVCAPVHLPARPAPQRGFCVFSRPTKDTSCSRKS